MSSLSNESALCDNNMDIDIINPYASSVNNLSRGLMSLYSPPLVNVEKQLKELTSKQDFLITQIHNENLRLSEVQHSPELQDTFVKLKIYHNKLLNLKKDMKAIYERSLKLKKRALVLQQVKEKDQSKAQIKKSKNEENFCKPGPSNSNN